MTGFLEGLNKAQYEAVMNTQGPALVIAGAGSGKTRVLTLRIANLLKNGVPASSILALTFTNKAAREMKERISTIVGPQISQHLWMGTFHSIFSKILRFESDALGYSSNYTIYDTQDAKNLIRSIIRERKLNDKQYKPGEIMGRISSAKNNLITADAYISNADYQSSDSANQRPLTGEIFKTYVKRCKKADAMDFDDLLLNTNILFRDHAEVLSKYCNKFKYILVDEYQDTNFSQYFIIKKLAEQHQNVCVVGDDAQSIYSFRGAKIENILNFRNDYPEYKIYKLEQNYRSTQTIVNAANSVILNNEKQIPKKIFSSNDIGDKVVIFESQSEHEEGFKIASEIIDARYQYKLHYSDFAILYRTNAQSRIFEEALRRKNIPYKVYGSISFYQRKEIKDVLSYYRLMINNNDDEALKRVINYPTRGIGAKTVEKLEAASNHLGVSIWQVLSKVEQHGFGLNGGTIKKLVNFRNMMEQFSLSVHNTDAFELAQMVLNQCGILKELGSGSSIEERSRIENIQELLNGIQEYSETHTAENELATLPGFMENVALLTDADNESDEERDRVSIMTVHASKGLEFEFVFVAGMEEELFPSQMTMNNPKELEEERRLFYVALTRAKMRVFVSYAFNRHKWGKPTSCSPSRFVREIAPEYIDAPLLFNQSAEIDNVASKPLNKRSGFSTAASFRPKSKPSFGKVNFKRSTPGKLNADFKPDTPDKIQSGMQVEHQRFGIGKVIRIEGDSNNRKARVFFQSTGEEKQLLLKFARLKIVN